MNTYLEHLINGYKDALFFAENETGEEEISKDLHEEIEAFCKDFYSDNEEALLSPKSRSRMWEVGANLYFTAHGHGVGFWDHPEEPGYEQFDDWCEKETQSMKDSPHLEDGLLIPA